MNTPAQAARAKFAEYRALAESRGLTRAVFNLAESEWAGWEAGDHGRATPNEWDHVNAALAVANSARLLPGTVVPVIARAIARAA